MTITEVTKKLIGPVEAIGDSGVDIKRLANLEVMIEVVHELLRQIDFAANDRHSHEASVKAIGKRAHEALDAFGITE